MAHIIINPSLSAAIGYKKIFYPPKFAVVIAILEPANSTRTDNSEFYLCLYLIKVCMVCLQAGDSIVVLKEKHRISSGL